MSGFDGILAVTAIKGWTLFFVVVTFSLYVYIAWRSRVSTTEGLYVASRGIPAVANGMAIGADWMSAESWDDLRAHHADVPRDTA